MPDTELRYTDNTAGGAEVPGQNGHGPAPATAGAGAGTGKPRGRRSTSSRDADSGPGEHRSTEPRTGDDAGNGLTRVTVNLNRQAVQALDEVSTATRYSKTDTINRALQVYAIVQKILDRDGMLQVQRDGRTVEIHIV